MSLKYNFIPAAEKQENIVIMLHGFGSSAQDLTELAKLFNSLPNSGFVIPNAPLSNVEYEGYHWFPLIFTENNIKIQNIADITKANKLLQEFIDEIASKYNVNYSQITIFGFSQGGIMAIFNALHSKNNYAAVVCHSGLFYFNETKQEFNKQQNILLIHGEEDSVVNINEFHKTLEFFNNNALAYEQFVKEDLNHNIDEQSLLITQNFIRKAFNK